MNNHEVFIGHSVNDHGTFNEASMNNHEQFIDQIEEEIEKRI